MDALRVSGYLLRFWVSMGRTRGDRRGMSNRYVTRRRKKRRLRAPHGLGGAMQGKPLT